MFTMPFGMMKSAGDPFWDNVSLLLTGDGPNGSTTILDSSPNPKTVTAVGDAQISTAQSKFGGSSLAFDGSGDRLSIPGSGDLTFGTGDFTLECWLNLNSAGNSPGIISHDNFSSGTFIWGLNSSRNLRWFGNASSNQVGSNIWTHVAATRESGTVRMFINGQEGLSITDSTNFTQHTLVIAVERSLLKHLDGYLDDIRITKGVARYTANFTPPTAAFPIG